MIRFQVQWECCQGEWTDGYREHCRSCSFGVFLLCTLIVYKLNPCVYHIGRGKTILSSHILSCVNPLGGNIKQWMKQDWHMTAIYQQNPKKKRHLCIFVQVKKYNKYYLSKSPLLTRYSCFLYMPLSTSMGTGKMMVEFFSQEMELRVCRYLHQPTVTTCCMCV